jgi:hypothetical protein
MRLRKYIDIIDGDVRITARYATRQVEYIAIFCKDGSVEHYRNCREVPAFIPQIEDEIAKHFYKWMANYGETWRKYFPKHPYELE